MTSESIATGIDPEALVAAHAGRPETWDAPMREALRSVGADGDAELLAAAERLLKLTDPDGAQHGKYVVDLRGAQGVQVGDGARMTVNIGSAGDGVPYVPPAEPAS